MAREVRLHVGTSKGAFAFCSDNGRKTWNSSPPALAGWSISATTIVPS